MDSRRPLTPPELEESDTGEASGVIEGGMARERRTETAGTSASPSIPPHLRVIGAFSAVAERSSARNWTDSDAPPEVPVVLPDVVPVIPDAAPPPQLEWPHCEPYPTPFAPDAPPEVIREFFANLPLPPIPRWAQEAQERARVAAAAAAAAVAAAEEAALNIAEQPEQGPALARPEEMEADELQFWQQAMEARRQEDEEDTDEYDEDEYQALMDLCDNRFLKGKSRSRK